MNTCYLDIRTAVVTSMSAGIASSASCNRLDDNRITRLEICYGRSNFFYNATPLMSNDTRICCVCVGSMKNMDIAAANSGRSDFYQYLCVFLDRWLLNIDYF